MKEIAQRDMIYGDQVRDVFESTTGLAITMPRFGVPERLNPGRNPIETIRFESQREAHDYMEADVAKRGLRLASGVGNDMSGPFYRDKNAFLITYHPDGIGGDIKYLNFKARSWNPESLRNPQYTRPYYSPDHYRAHPNPVGARQMSLEEVGPQSNP